MALRIALLIALTAGTALFGGDRPSVLVHCARPSVDQWYWWVDLTYLQELHASGFEVDYTDEHGDFTWERIRQYDVLVIYTVPLDQGGYYDNSPPRPPYRDEFVEIVERFLASGGSVLLLARSINADESFLPLIERWGARIPHERILETDPTRLAPMPRMRGAERLWLTDNVPDSPVRGGVEQVWLPITEHYAAAETMPIEVDCSWQVVLRGAESARTKPVDPDKQPMRPPAGRRVRPDGVAAPDLLAIREYGAGRIAFGAIWPQYSIGQGTQWLYERRVLSEGIGGRPSHFGRLLENLLRWLAEPGLDSPEVGGFVTDLRRLEPPNEREGVRDAFVKRTRTRLDPDRVLAAARAATPIRRGLVGARSDLGSGRGSVADYARAAREAGLDFVVFLEELRDLDARRFERLREACARESGADLRLWPGYTVETNTGNTMFVYGEGATLPPPDLIVGNRLNLQYRDPVTGKPALGSPLIDWISYRMTAERRANVGYLGFRGVPSRLPIEDLRFYSAVALELYRDGALVEENLAGYLRAAAGTIPPVPLAVHLVSSPDALRGAAKLDRGLTRVQAAGPAELWPALAYATAYDAPRVFVSNGPTIHDWPRGSQYYTFAAERFVTGAAYLPVPVVVRSETGLREVRIHDGERLVRRWLPGGAKSFEVMLELTASVQRNLVLVAEDVAGGRAVSNTWRAWKGGDLAPVFCSDRVNHCADPALMAKGPGIVPVVLPPAIIAGHSWDGGPQGVRPHLALRDANRPRLSSNLGLEGERGYAGKARLVLADEGAVRVRTILDTRYDRGFPVVNPWRTFGPLGGPTRLMASEILLTAFQRPTVGPHPDMWPGTARRSGASVTLFENEITFRADQRVESLRLFRQDHGGTPPTGSLVRGRKSRVRESYELGAKRAASDPIPFHRGDWIGVHGSGVGNLVLLWNRGDDLEIRFEPGMQFMAALAGSRVRAGERRRYEILGVVDPIDLPGGKARVLEIVRYLRRPEGLRVTRGKLETGEGLVELEAVDGAVELRIERPKSTRNVPLPLRVRGLNPRWSAGVHMRVGYVLGNYGPGRDRYHASGIDPEGRLYATLFPDRAPVTAVAIGHPVVTDREELFVQVTRRDDRGLASSWHVSVNNPTDAAVTATFRVTIDVPGLAVPDGPVTLPPGGGAEVTLSGEAGMVAEWTIR